MTGAGIGPVVWRPKTAAERETVLKLARDAEDRVPLAPDLAAREYWLRVADYWYRIYYGDPVGRP